MIRKEIEADQMPGQDSFLDVITNIVGILILLVLIVGIRTSRSIISSSTGNADAQSQTDDNLRQAVNSAMGAEKDIEKLIQHVGSVRQEVAFREHERSWLNTAIVEAEQNIAARKADLSSSDQRDFELRHKIAEAQSTLDELTREQVALLSHEGPTAEIACEPTPIARKVTGKEVHVLLSDDHVAIVPFDEMMKAAKDDALANIWRMRQQDEMERTIGPVNGFRMRYWIVKDEVVRRSDAGTMVAGAIPAFSHCWLKPITTPAGEAAEEAMGPNSELFQSLSQQRPEGTTVTIWTYPGNYERLRELKRSIRQAGYTVAVRPLPKGMPIGASRHGTETVSE
jgi:hypothetical protein